MRGLWVLSLWGAAHALSVGKEVHIGIQRSEGDVLADENTLGKLPESVHKMFAAEKSAGQEKLSDDQRAQAINATALAAPQLGQPPKDLVGATKDLSGQLTAMKNMLKEQLSLTDEQLKNQISKGTTTDDIVKGALGGAAAASAKASIAAGKAAQVEAEANKLKEQVKNLAEEKKSLNQLATEAQSNYQQVLGENNEAYDLIMELTAMYKAQHAEMEKKYAKLLSSRSQVHSEQ